MPEKKGLDDLRKQIDELDNKLVELLSKRAKVVVDVGKFKRDTETPIYAPHRERAVLDRVLAANEGPLSNKTIEAIYRELMSGSFQLEQPLKIAHLAPNGSFSHIAAIRHFGSSVSCVGVPTIERVFREVATGHCDYGLVPYENSTSGSITDTLDSFQEHDVTIYAEALIDIRHCLLCNGPTNEITTIASKPQVISQCRKWLAAMFPDVEIIETASSAKAVELAKEDSKTAAIGSELAAHENGVEIAIENVQDRPENITRFLILAKESAQPSNDDKSTIMFTTKHEPGTLVDVLAAFRDNGINLSHIDKRPSGRTNWDYTFYIDADAHRDTNELKNAVETASKFCKSIEVLGSYPKAGQIL
ncbi:MAG: prephenate dehydratase [Phycisphaerales bacterium]|nr:prephenate dehydratase [Planctomycetota bacterium]MBL6997484.1 prephenate dehydratase [Phycisphaerales bacterium]